MGGPIEDTSEKCKSKTELRIDHNRKEGKPLALQPGIERFSVPPLGKPGRRAKGNTEGENNAAAKTGRENLENPER